MPTRVKATMDTPARAVLATYITTEVLLALLAVAGNLLVIWAVASNPRLKSITNYFIVSLAVADVAVGVLVIPFAITISVGFHMDFHGCLFLACLVLVVTQISVFSLLAIAVDRYLAIRIPLRYGALVNGAQAKKVMALLWALAVFLGMIPLFGWNNLHAVERQCSNQESNVAPESVAPSPANETRPPCRLVACYFEVVVDMNYMVYFNFFGCILLPLLCMLFLYIHIYNVACRQLRQMLPKGAANVRGGKTQAFLLKEIHVAKSLAIIVGLFALCWLPIHILNCLPIFCPDCRRPPIWLLDLAIAFSHANSVLNPVIYAFRLREFRRAFCGLVGRACWLREGYREQLTRVSMMRSMSGETSMAMLSTTLDT
ncbi:adenosine receptor A2b-like [Ambystoma mexicanum]|uniref:adenosine receptor A2b-like n=1 Tax=Ambystoma mexicanum TaxID=8296 RepID=UPI0037E8C807